MMGASGASGSAGGGGAAGVGAGADCSGQVLVLQDMLGISPGKPPKFVKNFMDGHNSVEAAIKAYVREVKSGKFPGLEHGFAG